MMKNGMDFKKPGTWANQERKSLRNVSEKLSSSLDSIFEFILFNRFQNKVIECAVKPPASAVGI
jgi:hypothetical protein